MSIPESSCTIPWPSPCPFPTGLFARLSTCGVGTHTALGGGERGLKKGAHDLDFVVQALLKPRGSYLTRRGLFFAHSETWIPILIPRARTRASPPSPPMLFLVKSRVVREALESTTSASFSAPSFPKSKLNKSTSWRLTLVTSMSTTASIARPVVLMDCDPAPPLCKPSASNSARLVTALPSLRHRRLSSFPHTLQRSARPSLWAWWPVRSRVCSAGKRGPSGSSPSASKSPPERSSSSSLGLLFDRNSSTPSSLSLKRALASRAIPWSSSMTLRRLKWASLEYRDLPVAWSRPIGDRPRAVNVAAPQTFPLRSIWAKGGGPLRFMRSSSSALEGATLVSVFSSSSSSGPSDSSELTESPSSCSSSCRDASAITANSPPLRAPSPSPSSAPASAASAASGFASSLSSSTASSPGFASAAAAPPEGAGGSGLWPAPLSCSAGVPPPSPAGPSADPGAAAAAAGGGCCRAREAAVAGRMTGGPQRRPTRSMAQPASPKAL
mmetsp:Transcript_66118/g.149252  ORF Transcript_66118/g.149252 Transcript_66118/m.149252 type:complete len:498 (-) Transcript_66118:961-2454(-)